MNEAFAPDIIEYERKEKVGYMSGAVKKRLLSLLLAVSMIVGNTGQVLAQESAVVSEETAGNLLSAEPKELSLEEEDREVISESEEGISEQEEVKVNSKEAPAAVTLPGTAKKVVITSFTGNQYSWYYTGNITLKTDTALKNLILCPMKGSNKGTVSSINAGKFNLSLEDVFVGDLEGMGIKNHSEIGKK